MTAKDFRWLTRQRDALGDRFVAGAVLYTGERAVPFGDRLQALPVAALWRGEVSVGSHPTSTTTAPRAQRGPTARPTAV